MIKKLLATLAVALLGTGVSAATYDPVGVQNDVNVATVIDGGWSVLYQGAYGSFFHLDTALTGAGSRVILAARSVGSTTFDVLAAIDTDVFLSMYTNYNSTVTANGAQWYKNDYSVGFAGAGDAIHQSSADVNGMSERDRLSWHTDGSSAASVTVNGGWRSGSNLWLNGSTAWERYILTNVPAVPVPASLPLLLAGVGGLVALRRKNR